MFIITVAVLIPYSAYHPASERSLGLLKGKAECILHEDFTIGDEEMLES